MNDKEIISRVHSSMYHQIQENGFASPVQVLMDIGILSKEDCERWRFGKVDYLERICNVNLSKLSSVMREIRGYAAKNQLKPSWTFYKQFGQKTESTPTSSAFPRVVARASKKPMPPTMSAQKKVATSNE